MKIAILKCNDCGKELNRSIPFEDADESKVRNTSVFSGGPCPNGCRSTFRDLNINTNIVIQDYIEPKTTAEQAVAEKKDE